MSNTYSPELKTSVILEALNRPKGVSLEDIASDHGIGLSTLSKWLKLYREGKFSQSKLDESNLNPPIPIEVPKSLDTADTLSNNNETDNKAIEVNSLLSQIINELTSEVKIKEKIFTDIASISAIHANQSKVLERCLELLFKIKSTKSL
jgi:transposase-like protein